MSWMLSIWVATALLALCRQNALYEGNSLSASGYHLCIRNETKMVSFLMMHKLPYTVTQPCGGWLLWKTCTVTLYRMIYLTEYKTVVEQVTRCCDGYVQVGRYCALPVNRCRELIAKPGSCPSADGLHPRSEYCEWDMDCPGRQKCCPRLGHSLCSDPAKNYSENGGYRLNATVIVKTDYQQLVSKDKGLLNHLRLLQAMVTGALQSDDVSVYYLSSWPVDPYRTATSLLIYCNSTFSLYNATLKLHLLLKHIQEVSCVTVEDVDECADSALRQCSPQADCNNTVGSYQCACRQGYIDVDPSNPGAHCIADVRVGATTATPLINLPSVNTAYTPASNTTQDTPGSSTVSLFNSSQISMTTAPSSTSSVPFNSSYAPQSTSSAPSASMSSAVETPLPTTTCTPPSIATLTSSNVSGTSFCVYWSSQFQTNQTYLVVLSKGSEVVHSWETSQTMMEVRELQSGVLYNVTVTPYACGSQGVTLHILIKTDAQTLDATARLTNIQFTDDLWNTSSQAYKNLTASIIEEIYRSLSPEMKAMVDSGQVRIEIRSFSLGSVVVNFNLIFNPSQSQDIINASIALINSLMNSSKYTVDRNNSSVNDFNECGSGENDCSQWATCTNNWASYTCVCLGGFIDNNPERPGRACRAVATWDTMTSPPTPTPFSHMTPPYSEPALAPVTTSPETATVTLSTGEMVSTTVTPTTLDSTTAAVRTVATTGEPLVTTPTTMSITATSAHALTTPTITPTTTTAAPTTATTSPAPTSSALTTITSTTATTAPSISPSDRTTTPFIPTITPSDPTINNTDTKTTSVLTISTTNPTTTTTAMTLISSTSKTTITNPTTTVTAPTTNATTPRTATNVSMVGAISVLCRVPAITVTVARDFLLNTKIRESTLYLGLLGCGVNGGNATHTQLTVAWNECATTLVHNETYYSATVTLFNTMDPYTSSSGTVEVPGIRLEIPIMCTYMKSMLISADFASIGYNMIKDVIMGLGSFQVTVQLMNGTVPLPHNYSLSPEEVVVVEVSLNTSSEQIKVVINKCWGTPTLNPADTYSYTFLENSCSLNTYTKVLMNGNSSTSRVSVQIFSFVNLNVIYLHCQVHICVQIGSDTCEPDCLQRTVRSSNTVGTAFGSSGPLLRSDEESLEQEYNTLHIIGISCLGIGLLLFFIIGFVCLFYYQRNRIGHYNFNVKPKQENFTYLVFNT